jgi:hypothetical protein
LAPVAKVANYRDVVVVATGDEESGSSVILELDRRGIDRPDVEPSPECPSRGPMGHRSREWSSATHQDQLVDLAGDGLVHHAMEVGRSWRGKTDHSRLREIIGRSAVVPKQPTGVAYNGGHCPDQPARIGPDQQVDTVDPFGIRLNRSVPGTAVIDKGELDVGHLRPEP